MDILTIQILKPIRTISEGRYWIGVRDCWIKSAIQERKLLRIDILGKGTAFIDPKRIIKKKPEPFIGKFPQNPMMFYYFAATVISPEQEERIKFDTRFDEDADFIRKITK